MTNEELFTDLKQFIQATVRQEIAPLAERIDKMDARLGKMDTRMDKMDARFDHLDAKLDQIQEGIADTLTKAIEAVDTTKQVQDHEQRLRRLEQHTA